MVSKIIRFFLDNKVITMTFLVAFIAWGIITAPFNWDLGSLPRDPVPVDAIPDLGENQQIVYTEWPGRSPQDIEDQISYPLTTALLGIPGVQSIRSNSIFGLSSIYLIFEEGIEFYWSRSRILEKLNSLPPGTLPADATPALGPDATALGQIFWYTLEGRDPEGNPAGGWDPHELRTLQDFYVRYGLMSASGVAEAASIGGYVKEYQVDIDPIAMKAFGVTVTDIINAVKSSNLDIGARTLEFNRVEYLIRALGYIRDIEDLESSVVAVRENVPVTLADVSRISYGPASRRGGLDKGGAEAVGGVVVARYGSNPMEVIENVKEKIREISPGLPQRTLDDGTVSKVTIVPFYDRTGLIRETLGTLESALSLEILISIIVVFVLVLNLKAALLISGLLPLGVLMTFIIMRYFGVDANIVALSGIAIAIGVMVDVGIIFSENIVRHLDLPGNENRNRRDIIYEAAVEVAPAVITALLTTIISFLPVFALQAAEGKLFRPLAFTKTFAMVASLAIGVLFIPMLAHLIFGRRKGRRYTGLVAGGVLTAAGLAFIILEGVFPAYILAAVGVNTLTRRLWPESKKRYPEYINLGLALIFVGYYLSHEWMPLGAQNSLFANFIFVIFVIALVLAILMSIVRYYPRILRWTLSHKALFLSLPVFLILFGVIIWQGFDKVFGFVPRILPAITQTTSWQALERTFPGSGREFMPTLNEGSFLLMPTTMPHSGIEENIEVIRILDARVKSIPEVEMVVGKWGRASSALDPAPVSMFENVINYRPEYILDENGRRMRFKINDDEAFVLKDGTTYHPRKEDFRLIGREELVTDPNGKYFRQWREEIRSPDDIWEEIVSKASIPGLTSAPKLQPIQTRLVMLQTGMRAPMGIKVFGPDLESIEATGMQLEQELQHVDGVKASSVFADRVVGKPYLLIEPDRRSLSRYGLTIENFQKTISSAVGGMSLTTTVEGRERFPVRVRYAREFRDDPEVIKEILIPTATGVQVPLGELADISYTRGPQMIKSENTFLVGYVIFDKEDGYAEVDVVEAARRHLDTRISTGDLVIPGGVNYVFTGNYENQVRATQRLAIVIPVSLLIIFLILYLQFRTVVTSSMIFSGIFVAFSGGFLMIWLYGQPWFMDFPVAGMNIRDLFQMKTINLSVAVWVGFIALFGIATDDGVLMGTYLHQVFDRAEPTTVTEIREAVLDAGNKRVRPAMMTTATAILALIPVLTSTGKGSEVMVPMAIPLFGGMVIQLMTIFVVPVLFSLWKESKINRKSLINQ